MNAPPALAYSRLYAFLFHHWWLALIVMGVAFVLFGLASYNIVQMLGANLGFLARHGVDAVRDGGLQQLLEILLSGYAAAACYIVFKLCEKVLVERLAIDKSGAVIEAPKHQGTE